MDKGPALELEQLTKRFGGFTALDALDLSVESGSLQAIVGPNGAGKTTAIQMVCGLMRPTRGSVRVDGLPLRRVARRALGYCPQQNIHYPELSAKANLLFAGALHRVPWGLRRARATNLLHALGLSNVARRRADALSGGMQRRLNLALALMHDPSVVVIEEPEAGLDPQSRALMREAINDLTPDRTVLLTSHDLDQVERMADNVAVLLHGRLIASGSPADIARSPAARRVAEDQPLPSLAARPVRLEDVFLQMVGA